jgi:PAS domain S-box-containing protein
MVPRIVYWRNTSREADWLAKELAKADVGGELHSVDSTPTFLAELDRPRTDLIVVHDDLLNEPLLRKIQERCPQASLMLICEDEKKLQSVVKDSATHLLRADRISEAIPTVKSAVRHSTRLFKSPLASNNGLDSDAMFALVSDAVIVESAEHRIERWNPAAERLFGHVASSVLGRSRKDVLIHVEQSVETDANSKLETDGKWSGEVLYITAQSRHVDVLSQRRKLPNGGFIEVCTDVSDLRFGDRKAQLLVNTHSLLTNNQPIEKTLDSFAKMAVPLLADICIIDLRGEDDAIRRVGFASRLPALVPLEGALKEDLPMFLATQTTAASVMRTGKSEVFKNLTDPASFLGVHEAPVRAALQRIAPISALALPLICMGKVKGLLILLSSTPSRIMEAQGSLALQEFAAVLGSAIERTHLEQRLRVESTQSQQATVYKDAFLGTISHELRTPLQAMLGWTQLLRDARLSRDAAAKALDSLERSIKAQGQIISDLLDLSRISAGRLELDARPCELLPVVGAAVRSCEVQAKVKGVEIASIETKGPAVWVAADLNWLQRAFYNILSNAVKFTPRGGKVRVAIETDSMYARVTITDTGKGIDSAFLPHIFERFSQAETGTTRSHGGLGVGLAIVRHIVESHGGTVEAHSNGEGEGQGARFMVSLPICPTPKSAVEEDGGMQRAGTEGGSLHGLRILLVEDELDTRELLRFVLEQAGATVTEASTAGDGMRCVQQGRYDVLVSDIGLPEEDGNSMIKKIRKLPRASGGEIPALALTAYARAEDRVNALRSGFNVHVCKPVEPSELVLMVAELSKRTVAE